MLTQDAVGPNRGKTDLEAPARMLRILQLAMQPTQRACHAEKLHASVDRQHRLAKERTSALCVSSQNPANAREQVGLRDNALPALMLPLQLHWARPDCACIVTCLLNVYGSACA